MTTRALGEVASLCGTLYQSRVNSRNRMETQWEPTGPGSLLPNNGDTGGLDGDDSVPTAYLTWACHD